MPQLIDLDTGSLFLHDLDACIEAIRKLPGMSQGIGLP